MTKNYCIKYLLQQPSLQHKDIKEEDKHEYKNYFLEARKTISQLRGIPK